MTLKSENQVIGIDLDGVLGNLTDNLIQEANKRFNVYIKRDSLISFKFEECTQLSSDQVSVLLSSEKVYESIKPILFAQKSLHELHKKGWFISIITDRSFIIEDLTKRWLEKNKFHWDELNLVKADQKAKYAKEKGINLFVEDRLDTTLSLAKICKFVFLINQPYNQGILPVNVIRVDSWKEIIRKINHLDTVL